MVENFNVIIWIITFSFSGCHTYPIQMNYSPFHSDEVTVMMQYLSSVHFACTHKIIKLVKLRNDNSRTLLLQLLNYD